MDLSKYVTQPDEILVELINNGNYETETGLVVQQDQNDYLRQKTFECRVLKVGKNLRERVEEGDIVVRRNSTGKKFILPGFGNYLLLKASEINIIIKEE
jgi:co-chaperonin GroES (HSP10)